MTLQEGLELMKQEENAVLLDVRSEEEYNGGHVVGSINVPLNRLATFSVPKDKKIFVYCQSGQRATRAVKVLQSLGYDALNIGGVAGYPGNLQLS